MYATAIDWAAGSHPRMQPFMMSALPPSTSPPDDFHLRRTRKVYPNFVAQLVHWTRGRQRAIAQTWGELSDRPTMWPDKLPSGLVNFFMLLPIYCSHKIKNGNKRLNSKSKSCTASTTSSLPEFHTPSFHFHAAGHNSGRSLPHYYQPSGLGHRRFRCTVCLII